MGIFYEQVEVFNRSPITLTVRYDGQELDIPPGKAFLPKKTVRFALNQNPIMGSQDPNNPHASGARYLIGVVDKQLALQLDSFASDCTPLTKEEWEEHTGKPCRMDMAAIFDEKYAGDPKAKMITRGQKGRPAAKNRYEAGGMPAGNASFERREVGA